MGLGVSDFTGRPLGGRPRGRLPVGASLEGPVALSSAAVWRFARPTSGEPWLGPTRSLPWGWCLRVLIPRHHLIRKSSGASQRCRSQASGPPRTALVEQRRMSRLNSQLD
ncbi:hypothetical protein MRX96_036388 [Rhipicephalus microplus]